MVRLNTRTIITTMLAASVFTLGGCATKGEVKKQVGALEERQNGRIGEVDKTAHDALERAIAAGKLAEGKFVYSVVLTDDTMRFPTAASSLSPEVEAKLTEFAQRLIAENKNVYLEIQGHTDSTGSDRKSTRLNSSH